MCRVLVAICLTVLIAGCRPGVVKPPARPPVSAKITPMHQPPKNNIAPKLVRRVGREILREHFRNEDDSKKSRK